MGKGGGCGQGVGEEETHQSHEAPTCCHCTQTSMFNMLSALSDSGSLVGQFVRVPQSNAGDAC